MRLFSCLYVHRTCVLHTRMQATAPALTYPHVHSQVLEGVWGNPDPKLPDEWPSEIAGESMDTRRTVVRPPPFVQVPLG
jgi:hypothetical protein